MAVRKITIGDHTVSDDTDAYVIAEIGHNHEGDLNKAKELVMRAAEAGASAAKLQKRDNKSLFTASMYNEPYTGRNSYGPTYGEHREALEFGRYEYTELAKVADAAGIDFISTAFDFASVDFLDDLDVPAIKMASADLTNTPLLTYAAKTDRPLIISTGGAHMDDVRRAVDTILPINSELAVLQCTAVYPAGPSDLHLSVIETFRREFPEVVVGFSGHDNGPELSMVAYTLGARVVEKHFTLDRGRPGSDHHFSLEPAELGRLVTGLREARKALGRPEKRQMPSEAGALRKMGKKLVAARDLPAGHVLSERDIAIKSPGDGLRPYLIGDLVGRALTEPLGADADFTFDVVA
ncbi:N-acetylneuraminate synthase family protein [Actinomadura litoris]|uniref:N-acetylneuraminate synthase family protein n=1 Tax=Actinomadura litoris TaxID=2678616 RepID=UPI001FA70D0F|nr:N-acetylneuraminate synthase family protein [Actinomadura litoris]